MTDVASTELLTVTEAANMLRLRPNTLRDWKQHGRVPFVKLGRRVFFRRSDMQAVIDRNLIPARGEENE